MVHTCNRCRAHYEIGMFDSGHDYCMTCYVRIKEEKAKKQKQELYEQQKKDAKKQHLINELETKLYERRKQNAIARPERIVMSGSDLRKVRRFGIGGELVAAPGLPETHMPGHSRKALSHLPILKKPGEDRTELPDYKPIGSTVHSNAAAEDEEGAIILKTTAGLPVSLSLGQRNISVVLNGKSEAKKRMSLEFMASAVDSKKKSITLKLEPGKCTLEPGAEQQLKITFDVPEDAGTGPMALTAYLRENAVYVDRPAAKSGTVSLSSELKTPMELAYLAGSCRFEKLEEGQNALVLAFENKGESGGTLSTKSSVGYGSAESMQRAGLIEKARIKGKQKKAELRFAPANPATIEKLALELLGADSNGKEYALRRTVKERREKG